MVTAWWTAGGGRPLVCISKCCLTIKTLHLIVWTTASVPFILGGLLAESRLQVGDLCTGQVELSDLLLSATCVVL